MMTDMRLPDETATDQGLRIEHEPYSNGIKARAVYRGDERIYHDEATGVRHFLKGYDAGRSTPIHDLMHDPRVSDETVLAAAEALRIEAGGETLTTTGYCVEWWRIGGALMGRG